MAEDGIRTPNLDPSNANLVEVLGHVDVGGVRVLRRQPIEVFVAYLAGLAGVDPTFVAELAAQIEATQEALTTETTNRTRTDDQIFQAVQSLVIGAFADAGIQKRQPVRYRYDNVTGIATPAWDSILYVIPILGQSLALGATSGAIIAGTPVYPGRALMPKYNVHTFNGEIASLVDLREVTFLGSIQETVASATLNHIIRDIDAAAPGLKPRFATFVSAVGDRYYRQLKRGSGAYSAFQVALDQICRMEELHGARVVVPAVVWVQGENDAIIGHLYKQKMWQFQPQLAADIRRITNQKEEPILILDQVNKVLEEQTAIGQQIQNAQLEAAQHPYIRCAGPKYAFPVNLADHIHKSSTGANWQGQQLARAIVAECFGLGWRPLEPMDAYFVSSTRIEMPMAVPVEPLVIDRSGAIINVSGMRSVDGFVAFAPDGTELSISGVSIGRASTAPLGLPPLLWVDLAAPPTVPWVRLGYAQRRDATNNDTTDDGPTTGARGTVRDSANHASLYGQPAQNNWMVQFSRRVSL